MDMTPGPVPVYRALKSQPLSSELHVTSFSAGATVRAQLFSPRRHPWNSHHLKKGASTTLSTRNWEPRRACPSPCRRTATAEPPLFSAMLDQGTCLAQQRACQPPCPRSLDLSTCVAHQRACYLVKELQQWNLHGPLKNQSHGEQTLRHDGDVDDRDDVLHLRDLHKFSELSGTRVPVVAHNGHDNLVQEQHLWDLHRKCTVCTVHTCCSRRENCRILSLHEAATSATVKELHQREFHGFLYCLDQPHLSSTATGMSTLVQELPPGPENLSLHSTGQ